MRLISDFRRPELGRGAARQGGGVCLVNAEPVVSTTQPPPGRGGSTCPGPARVPLSPSLGLLVPTPSLPSGPSPHLHPKLAHKVQASRQVALRGTPHFRKKSLFWVTEPFVGKEQMAFSLKGALGCKCSRCPWSRGCPEACADPWGLAVGMARHARSVQRVCAMPGAPQGCQRPR